jgi:hypothetical protein
MRLLEAPPARTSAVRAQAQTAGTRRLEPQANPSSNNSSLLAREG